MDGVEDDHPFGERGRVVHELAALVVAAPDAKGRAGRQRFIRGARLIRHVGFGSLSVTSFRAERARSARAVEESRSSRQRGPSTRMTAIPRLRRLTAPSPRNARSLSSPITA